MLGDFTFENPTKLLFGEHALDALPGELAHYGNRILLLYGGGSIKRNGIYDQVMEKLEGRDVAEFGGITPNPTADLLRRATASAKEFRPDLILAVGGGSVCDLAKAVAASAGCETDPWEYLYVEDREPTWQTLPVGCVMTMAGTGSEMNSVAVLMDPETHEKKGHHFAGANGFPRFSILNPRFTMSLPRYQMVAGIYDIFSHLSEQYFAGEDRNASDYMIEGLMRAVIDDGRAALADPSDHQARSNLMWSATWALNDLFKKGNRNDFMVHKIGHAIAAFTDATHGMTLSAIAMAYYRRMVPYGLDKFLRFARNVWEIDTTGLDAHDAAARGLAAMESWMQELGVAMDLRSLGVTQEMLAPIAEKVIIAGDGYRKLTKEEILEILKESF